MANGRGKRGGDIAGEIRGAFIRAIKAREPENKHHNNKSIKSLSEIIDEQLDENPLGLLNALKGFVPKEAFLSTDSMTHEEWLQILEEEGVDGSED